eukprot:scaffold659_cov318-Pavlova_lutheri.AAC.1
MPLAFISVMKQCRGPCMGEQYPLVWSCICVLTVSMGCKAAVVRHPAIAPAIAPAATLVLDRILFFRLLVPIAFSALAITCFFDVDPRRLGWWSRRASSTNGLKGIRTRVLTPSPMESNP